VLGQHGKLALIGRRFGFEQYLVPDDHRFERGGRRVRAGDQPDGRERRQPRASRLPCHERAARIIKAETRSRLRVASRSGQALAGPKTSSGTAARVWLRIRRSSRFPWSLVTKSEVVDRGRRSINALRNRSRSARAWSASAKSRWCPASSVRK